MTVHLPARCLPPTRPATVQEVDEEVKNLNPVESVPPLLTFKPSKIFCQICPWFAHFPEAPRYRQLRWEPPAIPSQLRITGTICPDRHGVRAVRFPSATPVRELVGTAMPPGVWRAAHFREHFFDSLAPPASKANAVAHNTDDDGAFISAGSTMFNLSSSIQSNMQLKILRPRSSSFSPRDGITFLSGDLCNKLYEYVGFKRTETDIPAGTVICECIDLHKFLTVYNYMSVKLLKDLAKAHGLTGSERQSALLSLFKDHPCGHKCASYLSFRKLARVCVPTQDRPDFEFAGISDRQSTMLAYKNSDERTIARGSSIAVERLSMIAQLHGGEIAIEPRKAPLLLYLMSHQCTEACTTDHWVFIRKLYPRTGPFVARTPQLC
ncbi:hypothetical protein C8R44DRAFT_747383 [Mycena epipterygia]|nr:hypothetical protein C8R44DRAFT_747383 [Mycena epipterygia]